MMSNSSDTLLFSLPTHGNSMLSKLNVLREEHRFCDITLIFGGLEGSTFQPLHFHGHKVVLAASSDFLRDQFLLHEGWAELSVHVVSSGRVAQTLLLSCYTGFLEVPVKELVSYLTAASAFQMSQVVDKCTQAISRYLSPTLAFLKLEGYSEEKEIQQLDNSWPNTSFENQKEKDAAQPSTRIQEANNQEAGAFVIQSKLKVSQEAEVDSQRLKEIREEKKGVKAKTELFEETACCLDALVSEEDGDIQSFHTNDTFVHVHHTAGALKCKLHPPVVLQDLRKSSAAHVELVEGSENQQEEEPTEEENMNMRAAQLQGGKLTDSNVVCLSRAQLSSHFAADEVAEDSDSKLVQRPYLCRRCDKVFQHVESYMGHLKEHRQIFCLVCGKGFNQKSKLIRHIHVHTEVKPFRCPLCHKTFIQKAMLQDHLKLHTGNRAQKYNHSALLLGYKAGGLRCHPRESHGKCSQQNVSEEPVNCQ